MTIRQQLSAAVWILARFAVFLLIMAVAGGLLTVPSRIVAALAIYGAWCAFTAHVELQALSHVFAEGARTLREWREGQAQVLRDLGRKL